MLENIINTMLHTLLISIPEELFWVIMVLAFIKRYDLLDKYRWKENLKWIMIPTILTSISVSFFIYIYPSFLLKFFVSLGVLYFSLSYILLKTNMTNEKIKWYKIIIGMVLGMVAITLTEMIYAPLILGITKQTMEQINNNITLKFIITLPVKTFQAMLVYFVLNKVETLKMKYMANIFKDKILSMTTVLFVSLILFILAYSVKLMIDLDFFNNLPLLSQIIFSVLSTMIPTILIFLYILPINYLLSKIFGLQQSYQQMLDEIDETDV